MQINSKTNPELFAAMDAAAAEYWAYPDETWQHDFIDAWLESHLKDAIKTYQYIRTQQQVRPVDACTDAAQLHGLTPATLAAALIAAGIDADRLSLI